MLKPKVKKEEQKHQKQLKQLSIFLKIFWGKNKMGFYIQRDKIILNFHRMQTVNYKNGILQSFQVSDKQLLSILVNTNTVLTNNKKHSNNQLGENMNRYAKIKSSVLKN